MSLENQEEKKEEIKLIKCKNCLKEIEEAKFILHEGFCLRNNVLCSICKEPVVKDDLESHMEEHKQEKEEKEREEKERAKKLIEEKKKKEEEDKKRKEEEKKKKEEELNKLKKNNNNIKPPLKTEKKDDILTKFINPENKTKNTKSSNNHYPTNKLPNKANNSKPIPKKNTNTESTKKHPGLVSLGYTPPPNMASDVTKSKKNYKNNIPPQTHINKETNNNSKLKNKDLYTTEDGMTIGEYWSKFGGAPPPQYRGNSSNNHNINIEFKRKPVQVDKSLGVKKCEYCSNYVDNLPKHYLECKAKTMIENENKKYKMNMKNITSNDEAMAKILQKKFMPNTKNDEMMARKLQSQFGPNTKNDEIMARNLQKQFGYNLPNTKNDEMLARKLQNQFKPNTKNDELMARNLQKKFGYNLPNTKNDEYMARQLQEQFKPNTKNDEQLARNLQKKFGNNINTNNDEIMARNLQKQLNQNIQNDFDDEEYAKHLQDELNNQFFNNDI